MGKQTLNWNQEILKWKISGGGYIFSRERKAHFACIINDIYLMLRGFEICRNFSEA